MIGKAVWAGLVLASTIPFVLLSCAAAGGAAGGSGPRSFFPFDWPFRGLKRPAVTAPNGMVVSSSGIASDVGAQVMRQGGNAVDAAIASAFALAVTYPEAGNLGGGGFLIVRLASGETSSLDFREKAPLAATRDMYLDASGGISDAAVHGHLASGVPGSVAGLHAAWRRFGRLRWEQLIEPAIRLAEDGFIVDERMFRTIAERTGRLARFSSTAEIFLPNGRPPAVGSVFRQPALAESLRLIALEGPDAFYRGRIADLIVQEMQRGRGLITHEDLALYEARWRDPILSTYRGHTVIGPPPPSSGGVTLVEVLNILEGYDLASYGYQSPEALHLLAEAFRRAYADRNYYLGDPEFVQMPVERLTSDAYAAELRATISMNRASSSDDYNRVPRVSEGSHTTHVSVVDAEGNAVSLTTTINSLYGSGVVVRGAGFFLNNEMDDFSAKPGAPNQFGLVQGEANAIEPGKRMLSAMTPIIVLTPDDRLLLVAGTRGGSTIITQMAQIVVNVIDYGMNARTAVDAPRIHHQLFPDQLQYERGGLDPVTASALRTMGHTVVAAEGYYGEVQAILVRPDGTRVGAVDERMVGEAVGY